MGRGVREGGEQRRHGRVARARNEVVDRRAVEDAQARAAHEPEVERRDVRVADERLRVAAKDLGLEVRDHARGAVAAGAADHRLHARVEPHSHEVLGATLVLHALEAAHGADLAVENHAVARALERLHAAVSQPSRGAYDGATTPIASPFTSGAGRSSGGGSDPLFLRCHVRRTPGVDCNR